MRSQESKFKFLDRNFGKTMVLIPGWATDCRIFDSLDLDFNYLVPLGVSAFDFAKELLSALEANGLRRVSVFGWSMGGFIASDLADRCKDVIGDIALIGVRRRYDRNRIAAIKRYLKKNRTAYLYSFYKDIFSENEKNAFSDFKKKLLKTYLDIMEPGELLDGLEYLSEAEVRQDNLAGFDVKFIHGREDKIAPVKEAIEIQKALPHARFIPVEGVGHAPFLSSGFRRIFYEGRDR